MCYGEYDPTFDKSELLDCKNLITRIKEPHAWPSFETELDAIKKSPAMLFGFQYLLYSVSAKWNF